MIRSMTGFGSAELETEEVRAAVSARSVNHRYLDVTVHLPRRLQPLEAEVKDAVGHAVLRGRVELSLQATLAEGASDTVVPSRTLVASLVRALDHQAIPTKTVMPANVTTPIASIFPEIFISKSLSQYSYRGNAKSPRIDLRLARVGARP